ncbi:MAG TPA: glutaminyl-peptide cyclotransferase [Planctomycetaceae bacterium]|nr:glutaminyl-peptide cyclotransferase [Planctomycetaceae bacterium]
MSVKTVMPIAVLCIAVVAATSAMLLPKPSAEAAAPPVTRAVLVKAYPHDRTAFCQGLAIHNGQLVEGTGQYQKSRLRLVDIESGKSVSDQKNSDDVFGEGVAVWKDRIFQLTWKNGYLLVYDAKTLQRTGFVRYSAIDPKLAEGWGLTHDGHSLILSDGSADLRFINPDTFKLEKKLRVKSGYRSLTKLNELEFVNGQILANVWYEDRIACIDPASGQVTEWIDLSHLRPREVKHDREAVLNGIAWDEKARRLFVTGKHWPTLFEIKLE